MLIQFVFMNGIIIQQITLHELESSIRRILREEFSTTAFTNNVLKKPDPLEDILLSKCESAKLLRVSLPTFTKMVKDGQVKPFKIGKRFKFKKNQILSSLNSK